MLTNSLAPVRRAALFFGCMGVAVASLTYGAGFQGSDDQSSASVAQAKIERNIPTDVSFASVDYGHTTSSSAKRAIPTSREAMLRGETSVVR